MTEVIFLLLPGDSDNMAFPNQHLGPRVLAAELAKLVSDPDSSLHQVCATEEVCT